MCWIWPSRKSRLRKSGLVADIEILILIWLAIRSLPELRAHLTRSDPLLDGGTVSAGEEQGKTDESKLIRKLVEMRQRLNHDYFSGSAKRIRCTSSQSRLGVGVSIPKSRIRRAIK